MSMLSLPTKRDVFWFFSVLGVEENIEEVLPADDEHACGGVTLYCGGPLGVVKQRHLLEQGEGRVRRGRGLGVCVWK